MSKRRAWTPEKVDELLAELDRMGNILDHLYRYGVRIDDLPLNVTRRTGRKYDLEGEE